MLTLTQHLLVKFKAVVAISLLSPTYGGTAKSIRPIILQITVLQRGRGHLRRCDICHYHWLPTTAFLRIHFNLSSDLACMLSHLYYFYCHGRYHPKRFLSIYGRFFLKELVTIR